MNVRTSPDRAGFRRARSRHAVGIAAIAALGACVQQPPPSSGTLPPADTVAAVPPRAEPAPVAVQPVLVPAQTPAPVPVPAVPTPAPAIDESVGFVVLRNADTIATERFTRRSTRLMGELIIRVAGLRQTYYMALEPSATVSRLETAAYRSTDAASAPPAQVLVAQFSNSGASLAMGGQTTTVPAAAGTIPFINLSAAVIEQVLLRARAMGGPAADVPILVMAGAQTTTAGVRWLGADSAVITLGPELRVHVSPTGEFLGGVVPSQNVSFVREGNAPPPTARPPARDYSAPAGAPYRSEDVTIRNEVDGVTLAGTLTLPVASSGTRLPAVVLITGSGPQDRDEASPALPGWRPFRQVADTLSRRGIAVLRMDDRGVGGSSLGSLDATTVDLADDIRAALDYLRARPDIDPRRLGLIGHSEGALIAPMVAAGDPALRAIVLIAGPSRTGRRVSDAQIAHVLDERGVTGAARDSMLRANDIARDSIVATQPWIRFWMSYDPLPTARRIRAPVLILQGATDRQVSADQAGELAAAIRAGGNGDVTVQVFENLNHLLVEDPDGGSSGYAALPSFSVRSDLLGTLADWAAQRLMLR